MQKALPPIAIRIFNRQRKVKFDLPGLRQFAQIAIQECLNHSHGEHPPLPLLSEVEVSIISDPAIALVHGQFLEDPTPTDVITFEHGEILVSADTALANAQEYGARLQEELGLYIIHGLLHLNGFLDEDPCDAAQMHQVQDQLLKLTLARMVDKAPAPEVRRSGIPSPAPTP